VPDPQATLDAVERRGGRTVMAPTEIPGIVTFAPFADPEGNVVGIVKAA
jgi:predicted enzyme related to lactoylglutathione lyase